MANVRRCNAYNFVWDSKQRGRHIGESKARIKVLPWHSQICPVVMWNSGMRCWAYRASALCSHLPKITFALRGCHLLSVRKIISKLAKPYSTCGLCSWETAASFCCWCSPYLGWTCAKTPLARIFYVSEYSHMLFMRSWMSHVLLFDGLKSFVHFSHIYGHMWSSDAFIARENVFKKPTNKTPVKFSVCRLLVSRCPSLLVQSDGASKYFISSAEQPNIGLLISYLDSNSSSWGTGLERTLTFVVINP